MTPSTFELLSQLLSPSEHIPKGNAFGRRPIEKTLNLVDTSLKGVHFYFNKLTSTVG